LKNYNSEYEDTNEFEWKEEIFPPNLNDTETIVEVEEIIQYEDEESEPSKQSLRASPPTKHQNDIMNRILDSDRPSSENNRYSKQHQAQSEFHNSVNSAERNVYNQGDEDTMINLTSIENPLFINPMIEKENKNMNHFDTVSPLSSSKNDYDPIFNMREDEILYHDTNENPYDLFELRQDSCLEYETPEIKGRSPDIHINSPIRLGLHDTLISHKKDRIEQLIDRMHTLIGKFINNTILKIFRYQEYYFVEKQCIKEANPP
jgi:hypothetical protein